MGTYFSIVTCRNSENNIESSLQSLQNQTLKPKYVIVIDDGSTDKTSEILKRIQKNWQSLYVITNPDLGYDIGRVVNNWNKAIKFVLESKLDKTDYHMICTDDTEYERDYAAKIISYMDSNSDVAIVSGVPDNLKYKFPRGAGRFVRNSFLIAKCGIYPEKMGYESAVLYIADRLGLKSKVLNDARFRHMRELGTAHHFYEFGAGMKTLGYHKLYVLGRFLLYLISGKPIGRIGAFYMLYHYLTYTPKESGYHSLYDKEIRDFIRNSQIEKMKKFFKKI